MKRSLTTLATICACVGVFVACSNDNNDNRCSIDNPCLEEMICGDDSKCVPKTDKLECSTMHLCPQGQSCDNNLCIKNVEGKSCNANKKCLLENEICNDAGKCVSKTEDFECGIYSACETGMGCVDHKCVASNCSLITPCKEGMVCNDEAVCVVKDALFQCGLNLACEDAALKCSAKSLCVECIGTEDCAKGDCSNEGVCVKCAMDKDCSSNTDGRIVCGEDNKCAVAQAFLGSVWTVTESRRLLRSAPAEDTSSVVFSAARDEWQSFQIFVRASAPIDGVNIVAAQLLGPNGYIIDTSEMELFRQHQMDIAVGSYRNTAFEAGWYPDPLIPFELPASAKQLVPPTYQAVPFDLPADESHGFWIDVHVPVDASAGQYNANFQVTAGDTITIVPVTLTVWDFTLPRVATLKTTLGWPASTMRSYYADRATQGIEPEPEDWNSVEIQTAELLSRHRINCRPRSGLSPKKQADGSYEIPTSQIEAFRAYVDQYHVNAYALPRPSNIFETPTPELDAWMAAWDKGIVALDRPDIQFYIYLLDEPNDEAAYDLVRYWGKPIIDTGTSVKVMVTEQTTPSHDEWGNLFGAVNIWCPLFSIFNPAAAAARQAKGEEIWAYTALAQGKETPRWHIDQPLLNYRTPAWIAWNFGIRGLLYWGGMVYWKQVDNPWTEPATLVRDGNNNDTLTYNGEGTLVYPGRAVGYDGIATSLRLKALRDAIEDYEYLAILERAGKSAEARAIVSELNSSWFDWNRDPMAYETARQMLAELIVSSGAGR